LLAHLCAACGEEHVQPGISYKRSAHGLAGSLYEREDPRGQPSSVKDLG